MKYQHIGVREETAVKILQEITGRRDIVQVLDPTFLLTKEDWMRVAEGAFLEFALPKRYIFAYLLGANSCYNEQMKDVAARTGIKDIVLAVSSEAESFDFHVDGARVRAYKNAGPKEFLHLLNACDFVCTDSFHGTAFSLNFKKPFVEFMRYNDSDPASANSRVYDLLARYGLMKQIYRKDSADWLRLFEEVSSAGDNAYVSLEALLNADRERSLQYLTDAISS